MLSILLHAFLMRFVNIYNKEWKLIWQNDGDALQNFNGNGSKISFKLIKFCNFKKPTKWSTISIVNTHFEEADKVYSTIDMITTKYSS